MHQSDSEMLLEAVVELGGMRDQENSVNTGRRNVNQELLHGSVMLKILLTRLGGERRYNQVFLFHRASN